MPFGSILVLIKIVFLRKPPPPPTDNGTSPAVARSNVGVGEFRNLLWSGQVTVPYYRCWSASFRSVTIFGLIYVIIMIIIIMLVVSLSAHTNTSKDKEEQPHCQRVRGGIVGHRDPSCHNSDRCHGFPNVLCNGTFGRLSVRVLKHIEPFSVE